MLQYSNTWCLSHDASRMVILIWCFSHGASHMVLLTWCFSHGDSHKSSRQSSHTWVCEWVYEFVILWVCKFMSLWVSAWGSHIYKLSRITTGTRTHDIWNEIDHLTNLWDSGKYWQSTNWICGYQSNFGHEGLEFESMPSFIFECKRRNHHGI